MTKRKHVGVKKTLAVIAAAQVAKNLAGHSKVVRAAIDAARMGSRKMTAHPVHVPATHKTEKNSKDSGDGAELTTISLRYGKSLKEHMPLALRANVQRIYGRITQANQYDNAASTTTLPGAVPLAHFNASGTANFTALPLALIDMTGWFNQDTINSIGVASIAKALWQPYIATTNITGPPAYTNGEIIWTSSVPWITERSSGSFLGQNTNAAVAAGTAPFANDVIKSVTGKLLCYGAVAKPTIFTISVVQLKEDYLVPDFQTSGTTFNTLGPGPSGTNTNYSVEHSAFWQNVVRPDLYNPILTGQPKLANKMNTLASVKFTVQPKLSTEPSLYVNTGHMKMVNINCQLNRIQRYDYQPGVQAVYTDIEGSTPTIDVSLPASVIAPKRRVYLLVHATSILNTAATVSSQTAPSFDFNLRAIHEIVA
nr:MAG: capsid protein [Cressdnaviricota sp.]